MLSYIVYVLQMFFFCVLAAVFFGCGFLYIAFILNNVAVQVHEAIYGKQKTAQPEPISPLSSSKTKQE